MQLTARQAQTEQFIREFHETHGYGPSVRDVARWLGISVTVAWMHLKALRRKGRVQLDEGVARSIRISD